MDGRLHQRRVDDRLGHPLRLDVVAGAVDGDLDELGGALAVGGDLQRELEAHLL